MSSSSPNIPSAMLPIISTRPSSGQPSLSLAMRNRRRVKFALLATVTVSAVIAFDHVWSSLPLFEEETRNNNHQRFLSEGVDSGDDDGECTVSPVADPLGKYMPKVRNKFLLPRP